MERTSGIRAMTAIDLIMHVMCFGLMITIQHGPDFGGGPPVGILIFLVILSDILLLISLGTFNGCLIVFWIVIRGLYLGALFLGWLLVAIVIYHEVRDWEESPENGWYVLWGCIIFTIVALPFYHIYYLIVVKSYRKDHMSQGDHTRSQGDYPAVQYTARNAQVFIINRFPPSYDLYGQAPPGYEQGQVAAAASFPPPLPPIDLYSMQGPNQVIYPGGTEPVPSTNNKK